MSNSFRVGSISAAMNFNTGGFMAGAREVLVAASGIRTAMQSTGADTVASTAAMSTGLKAVATQAGLTSGAMGLLGKEVAAMATAANFSVAGVIARIVGMRSAAVAAARDLDQVNRAANLARVRAMNSDDIVQSTALGTGNEAAAMGALTSRMSGITAGAAKAALGVAAVGIAAVTVARQLKSAADASLELEHSFAFVRKTVDGTKAQLDAISDSLRQMALVVPISVKELNGVAAAAGQLGIARDDVVDFTRIMAEMGVATDLTAEQAAVGFAQWANITGMATEDIDNLTSSVVHLGNNTATTESAILNMTLRLAGASRIVGVTDAEMAGLSASLASLGIWAESGGNAMSRIMFDMNSAVSSGSDELKLFAATAGKTADQFASQFKTAPMQAIVDFIGGLARAEKAGLDVNSVLESLGVTEMESRRALLGLAGGHEKLAGNIRESTRAFDDNNARAREANTLFGTGVSKVELLKNATYNLSTAVGDNLTSSYEGLIVTLTSAVNWMSAIITKTEVLQKAIAVTTGMFTGGIARFLTGAATESGAERSIGSSFAINQEGFGKDKQEYMAGILGTSYEDAAKSILKLQSTAKAATVDVSGLNKELASQKYKEDVLGLRDLVDSDVFKREADKAVEIFRAVPDQITKEMRSAKFADMWESSHEGFKSVAEAAKLIPEEFRSEFIAAAGIVETELAKKGKSGAKKLTDELGKELEKRMEEAMSFRLELFPEESFAEEVRKVTKMAEAFPDIMTSDAVAKAFDALLEQFKDKGLDAVKAIKTNIVGIAPTFEAAMKQAVERAKVLALEAAMEARDAANPDQQFERVARGRELSNGLTGASIAIQATQDIEDLKAAGRMDGETMNLLAIDYWGTIADYSDAAIEKIIQSVSAISPALGQVIKDLQKEAQFEKTTDAFKAMGDVAGETSNKLRDLGARGLANVVGMMSRALTIGISIAQKISEMPKLFETFSSMATSAALKVATAMHIALNVIALIADAVALVLELFGAWGDEGVKELKGMAKVIDEIKEASDAWIDSLTDKLVDAIKTGQFAWRDFVNEVLDDLTRIAVRELVVSPLVNFVGGAIGFADGGAFDKGHIVDTPEFFNTKSGRAVRGEAGTEVVMPAVRLGDGTLGVKSTGGGGTQVIIEDHRSADSPPIQVSKSIGADGRELVRIIVNAVNSGLIQGDFDQALAATQLRRGYT